MIQLALLAMDPWNLTVFLAIMYNITLMRLLDYALNVLYFTMGMILRRFVSLAINHVLIAKDLTLLIVLIALLGQFRVQIQFFLAKNVLIRLI